MAHRHSVTVLDDLDGSEGATSIRFGLDDHWYSVDLNAENEAEFRELMRRYVEAAVEKPDGAPSAPGTQVVRNTHDVRKWLWSNGIQISARGRIPKIYLAMYDKKEIDPAYAIKN